MTAPDPAHLFAFANRLADASGGVIRPYFRSGIGVDIKGDGSPVTKADREEVFHHERLRREGPVEHEGERVQRGGECRVERDRRPALGVIERVAVAARQQRRGSKVARTA